MSGHYSECQVRLHRDALNTPWGIRLQGGKDFKTPLTVQRVFVGSPADGELHRGDVIVAIDNYDTIQLTHKQAQDIIKNAGGSLSFRLKRGGVISVANKPLVFTPPAPSGSNPSQYRSRPLDPAPFSPKTPNPPGMQYGVDYSRGQYNQSYRPAGPDHMLSKIKTSLDHQLWNPDDGQDAEYETKSIGQIKQMFSNSGASRNRPVYPKQIGGAKKSSFQSRPQASNDHNSFSPQSPQPSYQQQQPQQQYQPQQQNNYQSQMSPQSQPSYQPQQYQQPEQDVHAHQNTSYKARQPWRKPQGDTQGLPEPGWAPKAKDADWQPVQRNEPSREIINRPQQAPNRSTYSTEQQRHRERPAWSGSLRPGGGTRPWEVNAGDTIVPGGVETHVPRGSSDVPRQAPPSQSYQPQQHQQHSPNIHGQVHNPRVQNVHYAPGQSPMYQQGGGQESDSASVVHNQYNSPLGLYSKDNVSAVLHGQTAGKPGAGTMQVTGGDGKKPFNPAQSDVYRLLQEEEEVKKHRGENSARYQEHAPGQEMQYQGFMDHTHQSPKMNALEQYVMDEGTSDF